jgi:hypothetical protein
MEHYATFVASDYTCGLNRAYNFSILTAAGDWVQHEFLRNAHTEARPNRFDSLYSEVGFGFEFCDLGFICDLSFVIWDLNNLILEMEEL